MQIYPVFMANRGCPHLCQFCNQDRTNTQSDLLSQDVLQERLNQVLPVQGGGEIAFYGGTFTLLPQQLQADCLATAGSFVRAGRAAGIRLSTRPDGLPAKCLDRLVDAGVTTIEIGCQSFDDAVLKTSQRGHTSFETIEAVRRCRERDFTVGLQLMPGLPGADKDEAISSLCRALELRPDFLRVYPTLVIEGTGLAELWRAGTYRPWSLEEAVEVCADMLLLCRQAKIPVIRFGLQQDPLLQKNLLAGPHHPAFGQLIRSRLWRRAMSKLSSVTDVRVNPHDLSDALGHGAQNRVWLQALYPHQVVRTDSSVPSGQLAAGNDCWPVDELAREVN